MNKLNLQLIAIGGFAGSMLFPFTCLSSHNGDNFGHAKHNQHNQQRQNNDVKRWKSGSSFNLQNNVKYAPVSQDEYAEKYGNNKFTLTQPQRKSVNPWKVKKPKNNAFSDMNAIRPWGAVPEKYSKKKNNKNKYKKKKNNTPIISDVHANQQPKYQPFGNNNLLLNQNRNPSLIPIVGHFPTYTTPGGFSPMYSNPAYGNRNAYPFFGRGYGPGYLSPYRW